MNTLNELLIFIRGLSVGEFAALFIITILMIFGISDFLTRLLQTIENIFKR